MTSPIFYEGLQIERALFDLRRGLPVSLTDGDVTYFIWADEFFDKKYEKAVVAHIYGEEGTGDLITTQGAPELIVNHGHSLLHLAKQTELLPKLVVTTICDQTLKNIVTILTSDDLNIVAQRIFSLQHISTTPLPTSYAEHVTLHTYRVIPGYYEYYAMVFGDIPQDKAVDIRLHAECFTGDLLGSLRCDCGPQLQKALKHFGQQNSGILIYLRQEGRNIGLLNKMRAYQLQNEGKDTVDANLALGFHVDERDYNAAALILKDLGVKSVAVLTNNSRKITGLEAHGITVEKRIAHYTKTQKHNHHYIKTKQDKIGHLPE